MSVGGTFRQGERTHIGATYLVATFSKTELDVFSLVPLVVTKTTDEIIQGFLEPMIISTGANISHDDRLHFRMGQTPAIQDMRNKAFICSWADSFLGLDSQLGHTI